MKKLLGLFIKDSLWYSLKPIFTKLFNFILVPIYTAYFTTEDYGNLQYILAFGTLFRAFVNLGLDSSYWKFKTESSGYTKADVTFNFTAFQLFAGLTVLIISLLLKVFLLKHSIITLLIIVYLLAETIKIIFDNVQVIQRANHNSKMYIIGIIVQSSLLFVLNVIFIVVLKSDYNGVIYSYLIGYSLSSILFFKVLYKESHGKLNLGLAREMLKYGIPVMIGNIAAFALTLSDRFFLKEFSTTTELGLYSYGYKFGDLVNAILISTFFLAWNPMRWDIYEMPNGKEIFAKFNKILFIALPFLSMIVMSFSLFLSGLLTSDDEYLQGLQIIFFIGFSHVLYGLYYFNSMGMLFTNRTGKLSQIVIISGITNLTLNFILIPKLGMRGAALSTVLGYLTMFVLSRFYGQKYYPIKRSVVFEITQVVLIFILLTAMTYLATIITNIYYLALLTFLISFLIPIINFMFKNITVQEVLQVKDFFMNARKSMKKHKSES